ncbi:alkaline phosphatase-like [Acanthaster planci]|uniref:Alkaline phosphatase n=1 Tax=Acanthaster planci TaxID=133434 RepID=A0A8B7XQU6_ACAPL|nr:alkaline phosphatase-like [Acanthaster planci]
MEFTPTVTHACRTVMMEADTNRRLVTSWLVLWFALAVVVRQSSGQDESNPLFWKTEGHDELVAAIRATEHNTNRAEAVILFIGDGLSVPTLTAARIFKGQQQGKPGEETIFSFEQFPHLGYSKTYNTNSQVSDSAGTATAYLSGVKTKRRLVGLDAGANATMCQPTTMSHGVDSILKLAKEAGMAVGVVTTTSVTHATPAAAYAHTPERNWEASVPAEERPAGCTDIALQLIESDFDIDVVMGGGRGMFTPNTTQDPEVTTLSGIRTDGRNLIDEWKARYRQKGTAEYVWNQAEFDRVDPWTTDYLLGLFDFNHMHFAADRPQDVAGEPSIAEMTEKAIRILQRKNNRFFLFVEGGRIDHGNHLNTGYDALTDTIALDEAVHRSLELTGDDTLIVQTADHGHTLSIAGYPPRGHKILDKIFSDDRGLPYTTLGYANGPFSYLVSSSLTGTGERPNITNVNTAGPKYTQQSLVLSLFESHGGEDVAIFARGPMSHLFHTVHEQHYIMHVMQYAACIGDYHNRCHTVDPTVGVPEKTPTSACAVPGGVPGLAAISVAAVQFINHLLINFTK